MTFQKRSFQLTFTLKVTLSRKRKKTVTGQERTQAQSVQVLGFSLPFPVTFQVAVAQSGKTKTIPFSLTPSYYYVQPRSVVAIQTPQDAVSEKVVTS